MDKDDLTAASTATPHILHVDQRDDEPSVEDNNIHEMSTAKLELAEAKEATHAEKSMSFFSAIRLYPKAVGWSVLLSTALVMEGYDLQLLGNFYGFPPFTERYGEYDPGSETYQISAAWQNGLSNGAQVGEIIGLYGAGIFVDRFGYRKTMIGALFLMICFIFIPFFAHNIQILLVGEILQGIPWGVFQTMTTAYASEIAPMVLRPYLTTYVNLCWVLGQFIGAGVLKSYLNKGGEWSYRVPFAIQWIWPLPIMVGCIFAPESPWWYVRKGKIEEAKHSLRRLTSPKHDSSFNADETVAMMIYTNELEAELSAGTSYWDCFKGVDLRRTEIVSVVWVIQSFCGNSLINFSTSLYERAGLADSSAFSMNMGQYALGAVGTILSWWAMGHFGRRTLYIWGLAVMDILLLIIGFLGIAPAGNKSAEWAAGSMIMAFTFVYDLTVGPVCYSLVAEISSTRLKAKSIVLARNFYNIAQIISNIISPRMLNPTAWNWGTKSGFFWSGMCALCLTWTYFRLPEPRGRTYGEIDILFERKVPARQFSKTEVDQFEEITPKTYDTSIGKQHEVIEKKGQA